MVRIYKQSHIIAIITYIFYLLLAIILGSVIKIMGSATLWISLVMVTIAFVCIFVGLFASIKATTPSFFGLIDRPLLKFYYVEYALGIIFLIINLCVKENFPHLLNLLQIPIIIIFVAWALSIYAKAKYIGDQVKEEKTTVKQQRLIIATIDKSAALSYSFKVKDEIDALANKIRTMGLGQNENTIQIDNDIIENINLLNSMMRTKKEETEIVNLVNQIEYKIEQRREYNRSY